MEFITNTSNLVNATNNVTSDDTIPLVPRWTEITLIIYLFISVVLAVGGNSIILMVELKNKYKTSTDWLVSFMAINDVLFALYNMPIYIVYHLGHWRELASDASCKIFYFVEQVTMLSSAVLLGTVAIDRYFKTCRPHSMYLTPARALRACIIITLVSGILNLPTFLMVVYDEQSNDFCSFVVLAGGILVGLLHTLFILAYLILFVIVCVCYSKVAYTITTRLVQSRGKQTGTIKDNPDNESKSKSTGSHCPSSNTCNTKETSIGKINFKRQNKVVPLMQARFAKKEQQITLVYHQGIFGQSVGTSDSDNQNQSNRGSFVSNYVPQRTSEGRKKMGNSQNEKRSKLDARVDRTNKIMFAVTVVFLLSWIPTWSVYFYLEMSTEKTVVGEVLVLFARKAFVINTFMNPVFYIWLSSAFKENTRQTLKSYKNSLYKCCSRP